MSTDKLIVMALYNLAILALCCYMVAVWHWSLWTFLLLLFCWSFSKKDEE